MNISRHMSSIVNDLKRFAGPIQGIRLCDLDEQIGEKQPACVGTSENMFVKQAFSTPNVSITAIAEMILPPMSPIMDNNGLIHDSTTIAVGCQRRHIHKYFLKDIVVNSGLTKCTTCSSGTKFTTMCRELAESTICVPFLLATRVEKQLNDDNVVEYYNPLLKITLACYKTSGVDIIEYNGDYTILKIHRSYSVRKLNDAMLLLEDNTSLTDEQRAAITILRPIPKAKLSPKPKTRRFIKNPLPFTPELAANLAACAYDPGATKKQMHIIEHCEQGLCLENC